MRDQLVQNAKRVGLHDQLMMVCPEVPRHASRGLELVAFSLVEPDGERLDPGAGRLRHQSDDETRIDAAGQKRTKRDVAHEVGSDGVGQYRAQLGNGFGLRAGERVGSGQTPVRSGVDAAIPPGEQMSGWQLVDAPEDRTVPGRVQKREIVIERVEIEIAGHVRRAEDGLDLGPEVQTSAGFGVVQRLDAEAIARHQERSRALVPDGEPEHPAQTLDGGRTPLLVRVSERLGVGAGVEAVTLRLELPPELAEVVNLSV